MFFKPRLESLDASTSCKGSNPTQFSPIRRLVAVIILLSRFIIYPIFFSPLKRIPYAHPLAIFTPLWMDWRRFVGREVQTTNEAFKKYGPYVRLGPNEVAVNTIPGGITTVHGHGFENFDKTSWYDFFINYGTRNTFSALGKEHGSKRKRVTSVYAKSYIQNSRHVRAILAEMVQNRLLPAFWEMAASNAPHDILEINFAYGLDFVAAFIFGLSRSTNFLQDQVCRQVWLEEYRKSHPSEYMFWLLEHPRLIRVLAKFRIFVVPKWYHKADVDFDMWGTKLVDETEKFLQKGFTEEAASSGEMPHVYFQQKRAMAEELKLDKGAYFKPTPQQRLELASECLDHLVATRDTFGVAFSFVLLELSKHPYAQARLRAELRSIKTPVWYSPTSTGRISIANLPEPTVLEELPYLWAVLKESIRLRGTVPSPNPRITPSGTTTNLGPHKNIPPGVRISAFAWCLHRNEAVFPQPELWLPDRWLKCSSQELAEMEKWFWAFGSGSRQCLGRNVAMEIMRYALATIYTNFETSVVDDTGFNYNSFVTGSLGNRLMLKFTHVA
ncbi:cytochrome P450 [Amniculicola lignicola CBS 123094]|uniref:Cytochrome P450 n=1 Tax=Amniculicola lignicola CBS 123094 TaxID=1392246 RepID=A0A6A5WVZ3_9PLEO|nr:cytochrome P450 [Amniculicola lignicola CBS 123094]